MTETNQPAQCCKRVYPKDKWGAFHPYQCTRRGVVEYNGGMYCKQHSPDEEEKRRSASEARWKEKIDRELNRYKTPSEAAKLELFDELVAILDSFVNFNPADYDNTSLMEVDEIWGRAEAVLGKAKEL